MTSNGRSTLPAFPSVLSSPILSSAKLSEVLCSPEDDECRRNKYNLLQEFLETSNALRHNITEQFHLYPPRRRLADVDVEEDYRALSL